MKAFQVDRLPVAVYPDRAAMGRAAALWGAQKLRETLDRRGVASVIFAAAPSQNEMLAALMEEGGIAWERVSAFHMDNYV
ncbi:MAG TPA: glucosamine-6-phosphate deaminase, partial [Candidatus Limnocylindria bacterium]|nr:glucosamine-6-phosphate deaminase [Candidatus Limnocylindria bacterium]